MTFAPRFAPKRLVAAIALPALFAVGAAGCGANAESMSDEELRTELVAVLTEDGTITDAQATCVVDGLFEQAKDRDQINRMANAQEADDISAEDTELLTTVMFSCL